MKLYRRAGPMHINTLCAVALWCYLQPPTCKVQLQPTYYRTDPLLKWEYWDQKYSIFNPEDSSNPFKHLSVWMWIILYQIIPYLINLLVAFSFILLFSIVCVCVVKNICWSNGTNVWQDRRHGYFLLNHNIPGSRRTILWLFECENDFGLNETDSHKLFNS